ncbi:hypothetical protein LZC95_05580 [Pendulispora brunnea]|uniref:Glycosyltransferase RgtA/B/C/D-like domain-containing protein n=1 Tax=Pendulispora brunnea TaxID=2905690 RepID=A0ABZ2KFM7_9BACT
MAWLGLGVLQLACFVRFCRLPFDEKLARVPDDGFYYLNLARNFALRGDWSFDGGVSHTTGFHPIHAFVASFIARLVEDGNLLLVIHGALGCLLTLLAAHCVLSVFAHDVGASCGVLFVFAGGACLSCPLMAMEWPYVVAIHGALLWLVLREHTLAAFVAGTLAVLARIDAVIPTAFTALGVVAWTIHHGLRRRPVRPDRAQTAVAAFAGALFTFFGYGAYLWMSTGYFFQGSARMKSHWASLQGFEPVRLLALPWRAVPFGWWLVENRAPVVTAIGIGVCIVAAAIGARDLRRTRVPAPPVDSLPMWMAVPALLGTYAVYAARLSSSQPWYTAHFVVPIAVLVGMGARALFRATPARVPCAALVILGALSFVATRTAIWPHQRLLAAAGEWIRASGKLVVSYNAGILGYVSDSHVVNLDGLVNDDIHPYIFDGTAACYIEKIAVDTFVDTDCSGRADRDLDRIKDDLFGDATQRERTFGRDPEETMCVVAAWHLDRDKLHEACRRASLRDGRD